jgi:predicted transcriptional regulator
LKKELRKRFIEGIVRGHGTGVGLSLRQKKPVPIKAVVENVGRVKSTVTVMINTLENTGIPKKSLV